MDAAPAAAAAAGPDDSVHKFETWIIEECCYAGSLQQAVQLGGMQRFQEDGIPQMVRAALVRGLLVAGLLFVVRLCRIESQSAPGHNVNMHFSPLLQLTRYRTCCCCRALCWSSSWVWQEAWSTCTT
jgi:hypothetical protein